MRAKMCAVAFGLSAGLLFFSCQRIVAQSNQQRMVRIAELEIEPTQLEAYKNALREEIEASIRLEPGVLTLYAVSLKEQPNQLRLFETYASPAAYQTHLQSAHFKKYKSGTAGMVKSLRLIEAEPVLLGSK